jgi:hypothetical protein
VVHDVGDPAVQVGVGRSGVAGDVAEGVLLERMHHDARAVGGQPQVIGHWGS